VHIIILVSVLGPKGSKDNEGEGVQAN